MRLLVVGASGFLGGHVRRRATRSGMSVVTAGRSALPDSPEHRRIDLAAGDESQLAHLIGEVDADAVVNCAGLAAGDTGALTAANVTGVYALVRAMLRSTRPVRLVHLGSAAEYGRIDPQVPVTEETPTRPLGVYGATKLAGTRLVELGASPGVGLDAVMLRVFNPVGAGAPDSGLPGRLAAALRRALAEGGEVRLGPLDAVRDFVHADDVADAVLAAATSPALPAPHRVFNIGSGRGVAVRDLVKGLVEISGYTGAVHEDAGGSTRSADVPWQRADIDRARRELGWRPRRTLSAALHELWEASW